MSNLRVFLLLIVFTILFMGCSDQKESCYTIGKINLALESPGTESIFYEIQNEEIIDKIKGNKSAGDFYESKIKNVLFVTEKDTTDQIESFRLKKSKNGLFLIYRSMRFHKYLDTVEVIKNITKEKISLELKSGEVISLLSCNKSVDFR